MPSSPSPIFTLVLGAGEPGLAVLKALAAHPHRSTITVLLRPSTLHTPDPSKTALLRNLDTLGISTIAGDISSSREQDLARTFSPYDTLIGCTGMSHHYDAGTQLKIARAVLAAKVRRYIPWQFGVDCDVIGRGSAGGPVHGTTRRARPFARATGDRMGHCVDGHVYEFFCSRRRLGS